MNVIESSHRIELLDTYTHRDTYYFNGKLPYTGKLSHFEWKIAIRRKTFAVAVL